MSMTESKEERDVLITLNRIKSFVTKANNTVKKDLIYDTDDDTEQEDFYPIDNNGKIELDTEENEGKLLKIKENRETLKQYQQIKKQQQKKIDLKQMKNDKEAIQNGGFFTIQVHIIECRDLKSKKPSIIRDNIDDNTLDPVVSVSIFDKKKSTKNPYFDQMWKAKKTNNPYFDEILYFDFQLEPNELSKGKCIITVKDKNILFLNEQIGSFSFDLSWIYYKKYHEIYHQWCALTNTSKIKKTDDNDENGNELNKGVEGCLLCSIVVLGPNDEQHIHDDEENWQKMLSLKQGMVLTSPGITLTPFLLSVKIHKMQHLPDMDGLNVLGKNRMVNIDPFIYVEYAGVRLRSQVFKKKDPAKTIHIGLEFLVPVQEPTFSKDIMVTVMDYDLISSNDRVGCIRIDYKQLRQPYTLSNEEQTDVETYYIPPKWYYIYGAPHGKQRGYARKMNRGLVDGIQYRGQVLIELCLTKQKQMYESQIKPIHYDNQNDYNNNVEHQIQYKGFSKQIQYMLRGDLYEGIEINKIKGINKEISVTIAVANIEATSSKKPVGENNRSIEWYETLSNDEKEHEGLIGPFEIPFDWQINKNIRLPDVFIYLCCDNKKVSYNRIPLRSILPTIDDDHTTVNKDKMGMWGNSPTWYDMLENLAFDEYDDNVFPGSLLIRLNAGPKDEAVITNIVAADKEQKQQTQQQLLSAKKRGKVAVTIFSATAINPKEISDKPDPYVKVIIKKKNSKQKQETQVRENKYRPTWNETFTFNDVNFDEDHLKIEIWDEVWGWFPDKLLSSIKPVKLNGENEIDDKWVELVSKKQLTKTFSRARSKFNVIQLDHKSDDIKTQECIPKIRMSLKYEHESYPSTKVTKQQETLSSTTDTLLSLFDFINPFATNQDLQKYPIKKFKQPKKTKIQLRAHVYQARNLANLDDTSLTDAYLEVRWCGKSAKTKIVPNALDPKWYETLTLDVQVPYFDTKHGKINNAPKIYCELFDYDYLAKNESLGRFDVKPGIIYVDQKHPYWEQLEDVNEKKVDGEALIAFEFQEYGSKKNAEKLKPQNEVEYNVSITTLGLRDIQNMWGVHKVYLQFQINDIIYKTTESNVPDARNPNFNQSLNFSVLLPTNPIFLPNLNMKIVDSLCGGLINRTIGYATINIAKYNMEQTKLKKEQRGYAYDAHNEEILSQNMDDYNIGIREEKKEEKKDDNIAISMEEQENLLPNKENDIIKKPKDDNEEYSYHIYDFDDKRDIGRYCEKYMKDREVEDHSLEEAWNLEETFEKISFFRGKNKNNKNMGKKRKRKVAEFKGIISISSKNNEIDNKLIEKNKYLKDIMRLHELYVRLYVLFASIKEPQDSNGKADPYLVIKFGDYKMSTRDRYIPNTLTPEFYESFEFGVFLPGPSKLTIEVWDYDGIGDDLVGITNIDIEDRYYSKKWRKWKDTNKKMPLEKRPLFLDEIKGERGKIQLWLEILTTEERQTIPMTDIKAPFQTQYELRVIVWECKGVKFSDETTDANDLYITGCIVSNGCDDENLQSTDMHFRSRDHCGSFNWRMKFPLSLPKTKYFDYPRLRLQIWDRDFFNPNDFISEVTIELATFLRYYELNCKDERCKVTKDKEEKFWINLNEKGINNDNIDNILDNYMGEMKKIVNKIFKKTGLGEICISIEIIPNRFIELLPAGYGRDKPNKNPYLLPPKNRHEFSIFNPLGALRIIFGDKTCAQICCILFWFSLFASLIGFAPYLLSATTANLITD